MPLKFWDEAFVSTVYLINRTPSKVIQFNTPLERLFYIKPDYSSLCTFGCACWPNLQPYNTRKLEFRSKQFVFLGYSLLHKGFKCLDVPIGRVYVSRDVIFDEIVFPFSNLHSNVGARLRSKILFLPQHLLNPCLPANGGEILDNHVTNVSNTGASNSTQNFVQVPSETHGIPHEATGAGIEEDSSVVEVSSGTAVSRIGAGAAHGSPSRLEGAGGGGVHAVGKSPTGTLGESNPPSLD
jgi:hypothetical protein